MFTVLKNAAPYMLLIGLSACSSSATEITRGDVEDAIYNGAPSNIVEGFIRLPNLQNAPFKFSYDDVAVTFVDHDYMYMNVDIEGVLAILDSPAFPIKESVTAKLTAKLGLNATNNIVVSDVYLRDLKFREASYLSGLLFVRFVDGMQSPLSYSLKEIKLTDNKKTDQGRTQLIKSSLELSSDKDIVKIIKNKWN